MQYLGGKSRISKQISEIINKYSTEKPFVSLFCGTASVESKVISRSKCLNDKHEYLVALLKEVQNGWNIPDVVSKEEYYRVKTNLDENKALSGFVGFACSFGGKWWGGYTKNNSGTNYAKQSKNSLLKKMATLSLSQILNSTMLITGMFQLKKGLLSIVTLPIKEQQDTLIVDNLITMSFGNM